MKVKWTTITEDENTWPPEGIKCVLDGDGLTCIREDEKLRINGEYSVWYSSVKTQVGTQWRPMPNPPKKKYKSDYLKAMESILMSNETFGIEQSKSPWKSNNGISYERLYEIIRKNNVLAEENEKLRKKESPWKPKSEIPSHNNEVLVRYKLSAGKWLYGIGCIFKGDWSWNNVGHVDQWMEIPE